MQQRGGAPERRAKLAVTSPGDAVEHEADAAADAMLAGRFFALGGSGPVISRWANPQLALAARDYIASAPPELMETVIQQLRAARARPVTASGVPVPLHLGVPGNPYGELDTRVLHEDLHELEAEAATHSRSGQRGPVTSAGGTTTYDAEAHPGPVAPHSPRSGPGPASVDERPRTVGPAQPTGVEGTAVQADLDRLAGLAHQAVAAWRAWRGTMRGDIPGRALIAAARARLNSGPLDDAQRTYLRSRIGGDEGMSLVELVRFDGGPNALAVAELFGLTPTTPIAHRYHLVISGHGARAGAMIGGAVRIQRMVITYQNELGMHFERTLTGVSGSLTGQTGGGASIETDLEPSEGDANPGFFWRPDWFDGRFSIRSASAGGGAGLPGARREISVGISAVIFHEGSHPPIEFDTSGVNHTAVVEPRGAPVSGGVGAEVGAGRAWTNQHTAGAGPDPRANLPAHEPGGQAELWRIRVPFATQGDRINGDGEAALADAVARLDRYRRQHPDATLDVEVRGHASPRWRGAGSDADADTRNAALAQRRADVVAAQLRNHVAARTSGDTCDPRTTTCVGDGQADEVPADTYGSDVARAGGADHHDDDARWRYAEIIVRGTVYRETQVQNQPRPPAR